MALGPMGSGAGIVTVSTLEIALVSGHSSMTLMAK